MNAVEIAKIIEEAGAAAVAVHGRTRRAVLQREGGLGYHPAGERGGVYPCHRERDVTSPQKADELVRQTGCDGIMIARGAQGNPWIFSEMIHWEETGGASAQTG